MIPSLLSLFLSSLLLSLLPSSTTAQLQTYHTAPVIWHTFDVEVQTSLLPPNTSSFTWSPGFEPHRGMVLFNGINDYIDLYQLHDDYGTTMPHQLARSMSFEFWVKWDVLNSWSRILDCGNGPFADNIIISNMANTQDLRAAFYYGGNGTGLNSIAYNAITPHTWQHIVATVRQKRRFDYDSWDSAEINIYVDGALYSANNNTWLPRQVNRTQCFIGLSEWALAGNTGDGYFGGWLDDFFYYDYPLSQEAVLAHYVLPRPPIYELTFSSDPRLIQFQNYSYTYSWNEFDPRDNSSVAKYHNGFLNLTGDQHIDLSGRTGNSSVGVVPPPILFGENMGGNGTVERGWSIEILFKPQTWERFAKIFDFGNGEWEDNIGIGYQDTTPALRFEVTKGSGSDKQRDIPLIANTVLGRWYHVIVVMRPQGPMVGGTYQYANVSCYVDGVLNARTAAYNNYPWPNAVHRNHSYVGRSNWGNDEFFDMYLDTFRIYDYALTTPEVRDLYTVTHEELPRENNSNQTLAYNYHTGPVTAFTFTSRNDLEPNSASAEGTNFFWNMGSDGTGMVGWPHYGLAEFRGNQRASGQLVGNYINLARYPSSQPTHALPRVFGGPMSFEVWARWSSLSHYSRILDIGGVSGQRSHNIILGQWGDSNGIMFEVYSGTENSGIRVNNLFQPGQWVHIVASVDQVRREDSWSGTSALLTLYVNGREVGNSLGNLPQRLPRPSAFIGRSNWAPADDYFNGSIDAFYYYDYALQAEQVAAHYLLPVPPVFELAFSKDPRPWVGAGTVANNQFTYQWQDFNASDYINNSTQYHNGYLVLSGDEYVNLNVTTGTSSIGTTIPPYLFGATNSSGRRLQGGAWDGWTIEVLVKLNKIETGAKLFSFSANTATQQFQDEVDIGYRWADKDLVFVSYGGADGRQGENFQIIPDVEQNRWYHIIVALRPVAGGRADITCYVDGVQVSQGNDALWFPRSVHRPVAYLGASPYDGDETMDMHLDTFRIYDIYINDVYARQLYELTTSDASHLVRPLYQSRPLVSYTFDYDVGSSPYGDGTSYGWLANDGAHTGGSGNAVGVATFDGRSNWINMLQWPDDAGTQFPQVIGGDSMAFEAWVKFTSLSTTWARIFDLGNGPEQDNILMGQDANSQLLTFHLYRPNSTESNSYLSSVTSMNTNEWLHVVASVEDLSDWPCLGVSENAANATYMTIHINGRLVAQRRGLLPRRIARSFAYMGKSHWSEDGNMDSLFQGRIDAFYFYDHALSTEQVNVRYRLPKPPVLDLSFSADPRWQLGGNINQYTYSWQEFDPSDSYNNASRSHSGHLVLTGARNSYVNLSQPLGSSSLGTVIPRFGGDSDGIGVNKDQRGWSFEMIVKLDTVARWAKFIDLGRAADITYRLDNVQFGYAEESNALEFRVYNAVKGVAGEDAGHREFTVVPNVVLGRWYHIVVVIDIESIADFTATYTAYVDGVRTAAPVEGMYLPRNVNRPSSLIGASNWFTSNPPDAPFAAKIDALRMYDYALRANNVDQLYQLAASPNRIPTPAVAPNEPFCASPPPVYPSSTAAPIPGRGSSSVRSSSSSSSTGTRVVPRISSSSSGLPVKCKWYAANPTRTEPNCGGCKHGGSYPNECLCPLPDNENYYPYCPNDNGDNGDDWPSDESSSTGVAAASPSGPSSSLIAGVVVAILFVAAAAGFVYFRFFREQPKTGGDDVALLGAPPARFATNTTAGRGAVGQTNDTNGGGEYHRQVDTNGSTDTANGAHVELL